MSRTPHDATSPGAYEDLSSSEDIEILEVVGVDENGSPLAGPDADDVEVVFEDMESSEPSAPPVGVYSPPVDDGDMRERLLRLQADFENFKKRIDRERLDHIRGAHVPDRERIDLPDRLVAALEALARIFHVV